MAKIIRPKTSYNPCVPGWRPHLFKRTDTSAGSVIYNATIKI